MKFNWGHGITVFYIVFVGTLITVLWASFGVDHSLVVDDYYAKDIAYQSRFDKEVNALSSDYLNLNFDQKANTLRLDFGNAKNIAGKVHFYRPSNKALDFFIDLEKAETIIPTAHLPRGKWKVKIDCIIDNVPYYQEETFNF